MKIKHILSIVLISILFVSCKTVKVDTMQLDRSQRPVPGPAPVINIPTADQFQLDNGLKVIVVENHKLPRISYNLRLTYDDFLEGEQKGYSGIAGQMLRNGTINRSKEEIDDAIDFIGASLSTHGRGFFATTLSRHNETLLELISDILINPSFPEDDFERLINRSISAIATQKSDPSYMMGLLYNKLVFGEEHPFGESQTEETLSNITLENCKEFYNTYFRPNQAYLIIVGDIKTNEVKPLIEKYFGKWEANPVPSHEFDEVLPPAYRQVSIIDRPLAVQSSLRIGYAIDFKPNSEDRIVASLMNTILGGGMFRLNENLRETHGYTYGAYSRMNRNNLAASFTAFTDVGNDVTEGAIQEILNEMYRIVLEPVSEEELQIAKNYLTGTFALGLAEPRTIANFAFEIAHYGLDEDFFVNYLKNLEAVTVEDIQRVAGKYIMPENCHIMIVGKADDIAEGVKQFSMDGEIHFYDQNANPIIKGEKKEIPAGMTVEKVLDTYFDAIGGRKNIEEMTDIKQVQKTNMMGMEVFITNYQMAPHYLLSETAMGGNIMQKQLFDGEKVVVVSPMGKQEFTEGEMFDMARNQALFNAELKYAEIGIIKELIDIEKIDNSYAYKIEATDSEGNKTYEYYDLETGYKVKVISAVGSVKYSDYKKFGNVKFPTRIYMEAGPQVLNITVESIEINSGLTKDIFVID